MKLLFLSLICFQILFFSPIYSNNIDQDWEEILQSFEEKDDRGKKTTDLLSKALNNPNYQKEELANGNLLLVSSKELSAAEQIIKNELEKNLEIESFSFLSNKLKSGSFRIICFIADIDEDKHKVNGINFMVKKTEESGFVDKIGFVVMDSVYKYKEEKESDDPLEIFGSKLWNQVFPSVVFLNEFNEIVERIETSPEVEEIIGSSSFQAASAAVDIFIYQILFLGVVSTTLSLSEPPDSLSSFDYLSLNQKERAKIFQRGVRFVNLKKENQKIMGIFTKTFKTIFDRALEIYGEELHYQSLSSFPKEQVTIATFYLNQRLRNYLGENINLEIRSVQEKDGNLVYKIFVKES